MTDLATPAEHVHATTAAPSYARGMSTDDIWRACARVLNRVPAYLSQPIDGSVFFMLNLPDDTAVDEVVDALDPVTVENSDEEQCVVHTDADEEDYAVLTWDRFGESKRFMLVQLRGSYTDTTGGLAEVTVLPAETTRQQAIEALMALEFRDDEAAAEEEDDEVDAPPSVIEPEVGHDNKHSPGAVEPHKSFGLGALMAALLVVGSAVGLMALRYLN